MKKIINKIKANQNLCKVLKVLKLVLDLIVYGFTIFMIIGLAIGQSNVHNDRELIKEYNNRKYSADYNSMVYYYGSNEFMGSDFLKSFVSYFKENEMATGSNQYSRWDLTNEGDIEYTYTSQYTGTMVMFNSEALSPLSPASITSLSFSKRHINAHENDFTFTISHNSNGGGSMVYTYRVFYDLQRENVDASGWDGELTGNIVISPSVALNNTNVQYLDWGIFQFSRADVGWFINIMDDSEATYGTGYYNGFQNGYSEGYRDGQVSTGNGGEGAFGLISEAFNSIASILNIELIPNLRLGVLLFAPIIISLIIVIVKMVRG